MDDTIHIIYILHRICKPGIVWVFEEVDCTHTVFFWCFVRTFIIGGNTLQRSWNALQSRSCRPNFRIFYTCDIRTNTTQYTRCCGCDWNASRETSRKRYSAVPPRKRFEIGNFKCLKRKKHVSPGGFLNDSLKNEKKNTDQVFFHSRIYYYRIISNRIRNFEP